MNRDPAFYWSGRPVYRCRFCKFERVGTLVAVLDHERTAHAAPPPVVRKSHILDASGRALLVEESTADSAEAQEG